MKRECSVGLDLDGTLIDTARRHKAALIEAARIHASELPAGFADLYYEEKRQGVAGKEVFRRNAIVKSDEISKTWIELVEEPRFLVSDSVYPAVLEELRKMKAEGFVFHIVTARQYASRVRQQIDDLGLTPMINNVIVARHDPEGRMVESKSDLTRDLGLQMVVGDSEVDQKWAGDLGVKFVAVSCGIRSEAYWRHREVKAFETTSVALDSVVEWRRSKMSREELCRS